MHPNQKTESNILIPEGVKILEDKKTHARTFGIPFRLPDGTAAVVMVTRLANEAWKPEIKHITIHYEDTTAGE